MQPDGSVGVHVRRTIKGVTEPLKHVTIHTQDFVEPYQFVDDLRLDFGGEVFRVVVGLVMYSSCV